MTNNRLPRPPSARTAGLLLFLAAAVFLLRPWLGWGLPRESLAVYCAHDSVYAEPILREFEKRTGIPVSIRFDTEATKSLGLALLLQREKDHPRCDVFWNNQALNTQELQRQGLLLPYKGPGFTRIPSRFKDPEGHWTGFGARLRVCIVNTERMAATEKSVAQAMAGDLSSMAIAKPLYGTTLTHYSLLWNLLGAEGMRAWHLDMHRRHVRDVAGNAAVKNLVAAGVCNFGWTDTDDFFAAKDEGKPVAMLPVRVENGATICIPNSVAIVRGTRRQSEARQLVDFLLSAETELKLANSAARQVPLGPVDDAQIPEEVRELRGWAAEGIDLTQLLDAQVECLRWLKTEYLE